MAGNQISMNYEEVQQAISISEDVKKEVCELHLNSPLGFERSQSNADEVTTVINTMFDILCKGNAKLNVSLDQGSRDVKDRKARSTARTWEAAGAQAKTEARAATAGRLRAKIPESISTS